MKKVTFIRRPVQVAQPKIGFFGRIFGFAKRKAAVAALILVMLGSSATAFAYWNSLQDTADVTVPIGEGVTLEVDLGTETPGVLVPEDRALVAGQVEEVVITYTVRLDKQTISSLNFSVVYSNVLIGGSTDHAGLVNIDIQNPTTINNDWVTVTITVTLTEPADQATYLAIINQNITFTLTFTADPN